MEPPRRRTGTDPYGGNGEWSFRRNADAIKAYWADGIKRMVDEGFEGVVTLGMRGNGDVSLPDGDGIELMQEIIAAERKILADAGKLDVPQVWTLYKEVQRYWDKGLRVPDDVTVVFTDDNWGNIRKLPPKSEPPRSGGYGLYYHFDYVGDGRNYKWVDTNQLPNVHDQLSQAYAYGVDRLWVVNVGDLKNKELPTQFFLDYAWDPDRWPASRLEEWERGYARAELRARARRGDRGRAARLRAAAVAAQARAAQPPHQRRSHQGPEHGRVGGRLRRSGQPVQPRQLPRDGPGHEAVDGAGGAAERIGRTIPAAWRDAYYQLVLYQVKATANLYELRRAEFTNLLYAAQGRAATNRLAARDRGALRRRPGDVGLLQRPLAGGKWKGFQTQPHIDYGDVERYGPNAPWQQPELDDEAIPDVIFPRSSGSRCRPGRRWAWRIDGSEQWWPGGARGRCCRRSAGSRASRGGTSRSSTAARSRSPTGSGQARRG